MSWLLLRAYSEYFILRSKSSEGTMVIYKKLFHQKGTQDTLSFLNYSHI